MAERQARECPRSIQVYRIHDADDERDDAGIGVLEDETGAAALTVDEDGVADAGVGAIEREKVITRRLAGQAERLD
ncbi:MAG TPA: hypothetical protein PLE60_14740, partial [Candidatus Latescibacteria bacterium]|nr:hypothetical protein [Candidatus Latescibacterota bacterium]